MSIKPDTTPAGTGNPADQPASTLVASVARFVAEERARRLGYDKTVDTQVLAEWIGRQASDANTLADVAAALKALDAMEQELAEVRQHLATLVAQIEKIIEWADRSYLPAPGGPNRGEIAAALRRAIVEAIPPGDARPQPIDDAYDTLVAQVSKIADGLDRYASVVGAHDYPSPHGVARAFREYATQLKAIAETSWQPAKPADTLVAEVRRFAGELSAESYAHRQIASRLLDLIQAEVLREEGIIAERTAERDKARDEVGAQRSVIQRFAAELAGVRQHLRLQNLAERERDDLAAVIKALVAEVRMVADELARHGSVMGNRLTMRLREAVDTVPQFTCSRWCDLEVSGRHAKGCVLGSDD